MSDVQVRQVASSTSGPRVYNPVVVIGVDVGLAGDGFAVIDFETTG